MTDPVQKRLLTMHVLNFLPGSKDPTKPFLQLVLLLFNMLDLQPTRQHVYGVMPCRVTLDKRFLLSGDGYKRGTVGAFYGLPLHQSLKVVSNSHDANARLSVMGVASVTDSVYATQQCAAAPAQRWVSMK